MILDYETLAKDASNACALDCSYLFFDWQRFLSDNPYKFDELLSMTKRVKFDVKDSRSRLGFSVDKSTIDWWMSLGKEVRDLIKPSDEDVTVEKFFEILISDIKSNGKVDYWWSRSNTFDPIILANQSKKTGFEEEINKHLLFWKVRDVRTYIDALTNFTLKKNGFVPFEDEELWKTKFKEHSSRHDIVGDVLRIQTILRLNSGLTVPE